MAPTERSPLLPRAPASAAKAASRREKEPASPARRRRHGSPPKSQHPSDDDDESDDASDKSEEDDEYHDGAAFGGDVLHEHHNVTRRAHRQAAPLSYASDSSATPLNASLGLARRKPRWAGFRSKVATLATSMEKASGDVVPRKKTRRNRFRSSDYDEAEARSRLGAARDQPPPSNQPAMARVAAYCTSDQIGVFKLLKWLDKVAKDEPANKGRFQLIGWKNKMYMGVVHASYNPHKEEDQDLDDEALLQRKDAFYFATGCCVFWGLTKEEEATHIQALAAFSTGRVSEIEAEDMEFTYGDVSRIANDAIFLSTANVEEKLAISFAMSQSAKLDVFEERVEDRIRNTKHIPFNLATTGSIQYSQTDISKLIGQLFIELADVNLHSDILDEPDFLWEDDEYEPLYKKMVKYLDVANRVKILNKRLDILRELVEVLNQELSQQHGTKLEWIIIWLLVVEIVISLFWNILIKDLLGFFNRK